MGKSQKGLRLAIAGLMIFLVILVELLGTSKTGIYVYTRTGAGPGPFKPGMDRDMVLQGINGEKAIRSLAFCRPDGMEKITTRKGIAMSPDMAKALIWTARDRNRGTYFFRFDRDRADLILFLNERDEEGFPLFANCSENFISDPMAAVREQTAYEVFGE